MRRMIAIFSFLIPLLVAFPASALEGGITGVYEYNGERIDGVEVDLYKIADYNGSGFDFHTGFEPVDIGSMTNSELGEYGQALAELVQTPDATMNTVNGEYGFTEMDEGIYLVTFKDIKIGDYSYSALPIVLTMPDSDYSYQLTLTTKLEKSCPDCVDPEPEPLPPDKPDNSNTRDIIRFYIAMFLVFAIFETLTLFAIIKDKKKKGQNEKK